MGKALRLAMIGCGDVSVQYLKAAQTMECAEIVVVMDVAQAHAEKLGQEFNKEYTTDFEGVLKRRDVDAVIISVPHYLHKALTIQAAKAGKHVLCDKPIAMTPADGMKMVEACRKAGVQLAVNFFQRFLSRWQKTKELLAAGTIGEIIYIMTDERSFKPESYWSQGWGNRVQTDWRRILAKSGGGILIMNTIHTIDATRYVTGLEPVWASGLASTLVSNVEVEDTAAAILKLNNGAMWSIASASSLPGEGGHGTVIHGKLGQIVPGYPVKVFTTRTDTPFKAGEWTEVALEKEAQQYAPYLTETCRAILEGREVPVTGADAVKTLAVVTGIYESAKKGKPVKV